MKKTVLSFLILMASMEYATAQFSDAELAKSMYARLRRIVRDITPQQEKQLQQKIIDLVKNDMIYFQVGEVDEESLREQKQKAHILDSTYATILNPEQIKAYRDRMAANKPATNTNDGMTNKEWATSEIESLKKKVSNITPEQEIKLRPIVLDFAKKFTIINTRYSINSLEYKERRERYAALKENIFSTILTPEQMQQFRNRNAIANEKK